jgi:glycosyltransferase involved in cell wall biosynthesis
MSWLTGWKSRSVRHLEAKLAALEARLDAALSRADVPQSLIEELERERATEAYQSVYRAREPLVSVCVSTYHKPKLLIERCVASLLAQTYPHLQIIVIGDCCTDDTTARMSALRDPRVQYENLTTRGPYPEDPLLRWMVAGTPAVNRALELSRGDFITHLDHDDEHPPERVERLVSFIQKTKADLVYHPFWRQRADETWSLQTADAYECSHVTTSSVFYHRWLARVPWDPLAYRLNEAGDWNRFRRIKHLGARIARFPEPMLRHFAEQRARE